MTGDQERREVVTLTRVEAVRILEEGRKAGANPKTLVTACPYSAAGDGTERVRAAAWVRGYLSARK